MIIEMARVRIAGPRDRRDATLRLLQDVGDMQLIGPSMPGTQAVPRLVRQLRRVLDDVEAVLAALPPHADGALPREPAEALPRGARRVHRLRRHLAALARTRAALVEEQALLVRYRTFLDAFGPVLERPSRWPDAHAALVLLRPGAAASVAQLEKSLQAVAGEQVEMDARPLASGETAVLLRCRGAQAAQVDRLLAVARLDELPAPRSLGQTRLSEAMPALRARLAQVDADVRANERERADLAQLERPGLHALQTRLHDALLLADAQAQVRCSELLFVVEGWLPEPLLSPLRERVARELGPEVVVVKLGSEPWTRAEAPVALANPRLFRPFELITRAFPLPRYGSIDPTPFVAVTFPMFFGLMMGDVGYGLLLGGIAALLRWRSRPGSTWRAVAEMGLACALFAVVFGLLFGEFFGSLGAGFGMPQGAFHREEALGPFLAFTVALGAVHILLGLVLAAVGAWRQGQRRHAIGRGLTTAMIVLIAVALLAAFRILPAQLFTPAAIAVLVAFPVLVALEGIIAVVELMSAFGHILSYARIMALGTASLMLAIVANHMVGALGSALVGVAFALLFHLVNFAIGLFSPTIHALRLHYVEFFGEFYSPGGAAYRPLAHWRPSTGGTTP
ncbi:MAG TPA: V-type ATPase 116kDa subunit family protein [Caldimonas sp.]|nr:V-type ATPase 116kDa subunit family protein [Caldimonas sp.]